MALHQIRKRFIYKFGSLDSGWLLQDCKKGSDMGGFRCLKDRSDCKGQISVEHSYHDRGCK